MAIGIMPALLAVASCALQASEEPSAYGPNNAELAKALADPNTTLGTLNFNVDYVSYKRDLPGASSQNAWRVGFQPVLPYALNDTTNLFVRPNIPVLIDQPIPLVGGADVSPSGNGQGGDFENSGTDLGDDSFDTSVTGGQYFYTYNLSNGWQIQGSPTYSYNHEAPSGQEKWTLPVGAGLTKTMRIGKNPWRIGLQYWHFVKQSDVFGPDFQFRPSFGPVVPLPW